MATLYLELLGGFEARIDAGPPLLASASKAQALLAYLAMSPGQPRTREHLADLLWGLSDDEHARNSLRQTLFVIRRSLVGFSGLVGRDNCLSLDPGSYHADVFDLDDLAAAGHLTAPDAGDTRLLGTFLEGLNLREPGFADWLEAERRRCHDLAQAVARGWLARLDELGSTTPAIALAQRLLALDPLQEDLHQTLIRLYVSQGRYGDAARQYDLCRAALRRELGVSISLETEQALMGPRRLVADRHRPVAKREYPPVVSVFPFSFAGHDRHLDGFAARLAEDISARLAASRRFRIVSVTSVSELALGDTADRTRFVLDGSVRRIADNLHIGVRVFDVAAAHSARKEQFTYRLQDILECRQEIAKRIFGVVARVLERLQLEQLTPEIEPVNAADHCSRGMRLLHRHSCREAVAAARVMFERAIELEPTFARARAGLAETHAYDHVRAFVTDRALARLSCAEAARRAIDLDPFQWLPRCSLAHVLRYEADHDLAIIEVERAVRDNPGSGSAVSWLGHGMDVIGRPVEGLALMRQGLLLDPHCRASDGYGVPTMVRAALNSRDYDTAIAIARKAIPQHADCGQLYLHLASALGHLGRRREARATLQACEEARPGFAKIYNPSYAKQSDEEHYFEGLIAAGWG